MTNTGDASQAEQLTSDTYLVGALLERAQAWRHGYDLSKEMGLRSGTLYPQLIRLTEQGFLESRWEGSDRMGLPPRHAYRLTRVGIALAQEQRKPQAIPAIGNCAGDVS